MEKDELKEQADIQVFVEGQIKTREYEELKKQQTTDFILPIEQALNTLITGLLEGEIDPAVVIDLGVEVRGLLTENVQLKTQVKTLNSVIANEFEIRKGADNK